MLKFLILAGLLYAVYFMYFKKPNSISKKPKKDMEKESETMVECKQCSTFISVSEALISDGKYFCSKECVDAYHRS